MKWLAKRRIARFATDVQMLCAKIRSGASPDDIIELDRLVHSWPAEYYSRRYPALAILGKQAVYEARVVLSIYQK